ncbi:hypothetical protein M8C13_02305 [Crossiella sp. SN42]|uniref:hypothetical protein n=1 Tax=Crossiella sp. SN42 TaxID=2944808 RepID=UPI00207D6D83|nr:hypothetical protein [Crossiella sp. SN42]MCO1574589.1 hypothetical protein [Crossiella sp. SN42]
MRDVAPRHDGAARVTGALAEARRQLTEAETALRAGTPDAGEVSAVVTGAHEVTSALASLVEAAMEHTPVLAGTHGAEVSTEVLADLRAVHRCLTTGTLLLAPALDDLHLGTAATEVRP